MNKEEKAKARAQARGDYMAGMSYREISAKYGISVGLVAKWAKADAWENNLVRDARKTEREQQKKREQEKCEREQQAREQQEAPWALPEEQETQIQVIEYADFDLLRESALLALEKINEFLRRDKALAPRDIKSITGALLDLKNQLNALSPRELREMTLRLRSLEKQTETQQAQDPVVIEFVNMEGADA